jgi:hypothetical protein
MASNIFKPNDEQEACIKILENFISSNTPFSKLLINGSAGTGKTTIIIKTILDIILDSFLPMLNEITIINDKLFKQITATLPTFIISAPTNKAKDVLELKYNLFLSSIEIPRNIERHKYQIYNILNRQIIFLTVSQVLSIKLQINEMGEEEFTKGNDKKIVERYNSPRFDNTFIIVDECSMIESKITKLLTLIKCPIIYIGDYCQLPPVNEVISETFTLEHNSKTIFVVRLTKVERCKNNITLLANQLRDKIFGTLESFNLLSKNPNSPAELVIYNKRFSKWLESYVADIKIKFQYLNDMPSSTAIQTTSQTQSQTPIQSTTQNIFLDTMALGWTNKCCSYLNKKIRNMLFQSDNKYLIDGDKLLIKTPYFKYDSRIYSSTIVYASKPLSVKYYPLSFKEWANILNTNIRTKNPTLPTFEINLDSLLDSSTTPAITQSTITPAHTSPSATQSTTKSITDYFEVTEKKEKKKSPKSEKQLEKLVGTKAKQFSEEDLLNRRQFCIHHNFADVSKSITEACFKDEFSLKHSSDLDKIRTNIFEKDRTNAYTNWHKKMSTSLFGVPIDNHYCLKCEFFMKHFASSFESSQIIQDFIKQTENLNLELYLADLATFNTIGKTKYTQVPIIDISNEENKDKIESIRNLIKNSYEIKKTLNKVEQAELKHVNVVLGEEDDTNKYITLAQLFGHYFNHIIKTVFIEVDYGYALTVHKSQGSTYDDVYVEYSNLMDNRKENEKNKLLYTAITRCSNKLHIFA